MQVRKYETRDWPAVWQILEPIFRAGETYAYPRDVTEEHARGSWTGAGKHTFVVEDEGQLLGTYYLKANHPGPGSHVCNCGYAVASDARGRGLASTMCEHSQEKAVELGFNAMQFNFVAASNAGAVRLWKRLGFEVVGTLPLAFKHPKLGLVDAYVMFKTLGGGD